MNERHAFKMGSFGGVLGTEGGAGGSSYGGPGSLPQDYTGNANLQDTYGHLLGIANGTGPNPAMAQYNQNVQNLARQQSGAIASIQGISPALAARMASQQGSAAMQNAAGQGATMQAQQQLGALGQMGNVAGQQATIAAGMQQNVNNVNAGLANQMGERGQAAAGGSMNGAGSAIAAASGAQGGEVGRDFANPQKMADGGMAGAPMSQFTQFLNSAAGNPIAADVNTFTIPTLTAPSEKTPQYAKKKSNGGVENTGQGPTNDNAAKLNSDIPYATPTYNSDFFRGGRVGAPVQALVSPGELRIPRNKVAAVANGKSPFIVGEKIPGKPKVPGNSYSNDTVPKTLRTGDVIIPNAIMQSKDPVRGAQDMVAKIIARRKGAK